MSPAAGRPVATAEDVLTLLADEVTQVRSEEPTLARARVVATLAEKLLRTLEVGEHERRLRALEDALDGTALDGQSRRWTA